MSVMKYCNGLVLVFSLVLLAACDDDERPLGQFESGVFVVNEGNFSDADGTISYWDKASSVTHDLFGLVNNDRALGDVVQSMTIDGDLAYVVVNNSNKVEVVEANTFKAVYTLEEVKLPRYFTTYNGKGYLTEWVSFADQGRVSVVDLTSHEVKETITTDYGAENIIQHQGRLYVSNSFTNTVTVIDPVEEEVVNTIEVGDSPGAFLVDKENYLWVVCGGGYDENYNPLNNGSLVQLNPATSTDPEANSSTIKKTISLGKNISAKATIDVMNDAIYYYKGKSVYKIGTSATEAPAEPLFTETNAVSFYGIGLDASSGILYVADSKAFSGNGTVFTYNRSGTFIKSFEAGRGPNGFVFR